MSRILAIDWGKKRTGIAVSDPLQIIATPLETVETGQLVGWLKKYFLSENVERVLLGYPRALNGAPTDATAGVEKFAGQFRKIFPNLPLQEIDERFSSKRASEAILQMGLSKKARASKPLIDQTAAALLLQDYLAGPGAGSTL